jgi:uncharacterized damage-inducible protein DinB
MATTEQGLTTEFAKAYCDMMLMGITRESEATKRTLAAVPDDRRDYKPDPNARSAWELAWHIANTDVQFLDGIADLKFNMETPAEEDKPRTSAELVAWYDKNLNRAASRVRAMTAEQLVTPINFFGVFNLPAAFYLGFLNNHSIHHRGQLSTYLRPMGAKVPAIYGGSYDEPFQPPATQAA